VDGSNDSTPRGLPSPSDLVPGTLAWRLQIATLAHRKFFNIFGQDQETADLIGKPYVEGTFNAYNVNDFIKYVQAVGYAPGSGTVIPRILGAMERAGLLMSAGWTQGYPMLGQQYITQGVPSRQNQGNLWLSEVLGPDLIIESYKAVTVQISGGDDAPWGTGLILDESHVLTNKHVLMKLAKGGYPLQIHVRFGAPWEGSQKIMAVMHKDIDVAVLRVEPPNDGCFFPLPGMVFRDPAWADEVYLLGYPRVPWMVGSDIILQRGEVVNPLAEAPPVRERDSDPWDIPERTKMFLYSAIARPGNSGGPIIAHDGRVIGIVVEDSMAASSSDPDNDSQPKSQERFPTLKAALGECLGLVRCTPNQSTEQQAESAKLPKSAPFYRGIPPSEIRRALRELDELDEANSLNLEGLIVIEDPLNL
jgi:hypothetical protein